MEFRVDEESESGGSDEGAGAAAAGPSEPLLVSGRGSQGGWDDYDVVWLVVNL